MTIDIEFLYQGLIVPILLIKSSGIFIYEKVIKLSTDEKLRTDVYYKNWILFSNQQRIKLFLHPD